MTSTTTKNIEFFSFCQIQHDNIDCYVNLETLSRFMLAINFILIYGDGPSNSAMCSNMVHQMDLILQNCDLTEKIRFPLDRQLGLFSSNISKRNLI